MSFKQKLIEKIEDIFIPILAFLYFIFEVSLAILLSPFWLIYRIINFILKKGKVSNFWDEEASQSFFDRDLLGNFYGKGRQK